MLRLACLHATRLSLACLHARSQGTLVVIEDLIRNMIETPLLHVARGRVCGCIPGLRTGARKRRHQQRCAGMSSAGRLPLAAEQRSRTRRRRGRGTVQAHACIQRALPCCAQETPGRQAHMMRAARLTDVDLLGF